MTLKTEKEEPEFIDSEPELEQVLTTPSHLLVQSIRSLSSPLVILGAGGKMGPTLAVLARRAADKAGHPLEVVAVSRFSDVHAREWLERSGVRTMACDLFEADPWRRLPDTRNLVYLVGFKFGATQSPALAWAVNTILPARVAERYPDSRIVALSTGNVYPLSKVSRGGSVEGDPLRPLGEYANAAVARERVFEYCSQRHATPVVLLRLFYAVELRYGVVADIARKVWTGAPIRLNNGAFNCIWQGDANDMILRSFFLAGSPPTPWNLCRPEIFPVREIAVKLGQLLDRNPRFIGAEAATALLGNAARLCAQLGEPPTTMATILRWVTRWVKNDGRSLNKATHFEVRDGRY